MSIYLKTFNSIVTQEISRFAILFAVFMLAFTGSVFLAMKGSNEDMVDKTNNNSR